MRPLVAFESAIARAERQVHLYEILHDTRKRNAKSPWPDDFKKLIGGSWTGDSSTPVRVDGHNKKSILVFSGTLGVSRAWFSHDGLSDLLRCAISMAMSAIDRYMHDMVTQRAWSLLEGSGIPDELREETIPIAVVRRALDNLRKRKSARPGNYIMSVFQERLHHRPFQNPSDVLKAARMAGGPGEFWKTVGSKMDPTAKADEVIAKLRAIFVRRNQIVHEADMPRKRKGRKVTWREITSTEAKTIVEWCKGFIRAVDLVLDEH